jgi:hypothetical protein
MKPLSAGGTVKRLQKSMDYYPISENAVYAHSLHTFQTGTRADQHLGIVSEAVHLNFLFPSSDCLCNGHFGQLLCTAGWEFILPFGLGMTVELPHKSEVTFPAHPRHAGGLRHETWLKTKREEKGCGELMEKAAGDYGLISNLARGGRPGRWNFSSLTPTRRTPIEFLRSRTLLSRPDVVSYSYSTV